MTGNKTPMGPPATRGWVIAGFAAIYVLWGGTYLAIALGLRSIPPFLLMSARAVLAGLILLALARLWGFKLPRADEWLRAAVAGILLFGGCHGALAYAEQHVPSGLAAVMLATIPFWIVLINRLMPAGERPKAASLIVLVPGFAGVALIAWSGSAASDRAIDPTMLLLLVGAAFSWALGSVYSQRCAADIPAMSLSGMQLFCGGSILFAVSGFVGEWRDFAPERMSTVAILAIAYLTLAGGVVAFTAYVWLLDHLPGPIVATSTFVNPAIAVLLGWSVLGERLTAFMILGVALVVGSIVGLSFLQSHETAARSRARRTGAKLD